MNFKSWCALALVPIACFAFLVSYFGVWPWMAALAVVPIGVWALCLGITLARESESTGG